MSLLVSGAGNASRVLEGAMLVVVATAGVLVGGVAVRVTTGMVGTFTATGTASGWRGAVAGLLTGAAGAFVVGAVACWAGLR